MAQEELACATYSVVEAAARIGCSRGAVLKAVRSGRLAAIRIEKKAFILRESVEAWIAEARAEWLAHKDGGAR